MKDNIEELIEKIDKELEELEEEEYLKKHNKIIENLEFDIQSLNCNIEEIYNKHLCELNKLIGLEEVKNEIKKLINYLIFVRKMKNQKFLEKNNLNMVFRGNPGTGKTTVARIVSKILYDLGYLRNDIVIETTPRDFISGYVGQTAIKAKNKIRQAKGGIIFIDEAYAFSKSIDDSKSSFAPEAIVEIIKEMETGNTVFIFSGYSKEMENFINMNAGIKSRLGYDIEFRNYTKEELFMMFVKKIEKLELKLSTDAEEILKQKIEDKMKIKNFGNGRMIDNLFNEILREHASINIFETNAEKLTTITKDSILNIKERKEGGMLFG